jgi:hypothetical protein
VDSKGTFSWLPRNRRLGKDYERKGQLSETLIEVATVRLILKRPDRPAQTLQDTLLDKLLVQTYKSSRHVQGTKRPALETGRAVV